MKTIVYQSFRTHDVPGWIDVCLRSVRAWADLQGYAYRFYDDRFFDWVPASVRPRASAHKCLLSDYARVVAARHLLDEGWDRAVWVDADALVFDPQPFTLAPTQGYAFCREVWLDRISFGRPQFQLTVNNAVSVFCRDETFSGPYLEEAQHILAGPDPLTPFSIGTQWLLRRRQHVAFPLLREVGIFGPTLAQRYLDNDPAFLRPYLRFQGSPLRAVNLCLSKATSELPASQALQHQTAEAVIARLLADRGASLNAWFVPGSRPPANTFGRPLTRYLAWRLALKRLLGRT